MARHYIIKYQLASAAFFCFLLLTCGTTGYAQQQTPEDKLDEKFLANIAKNILIKYMPDPAVQSKKHWGLQKEVTVRWNIEKTGTFRWKSEPVKELKNDGHWYRVAMSPVEPDTKLNLELSNINWPEAGKTTFTAQISGPICFRFEQQFWKSGYRFYSGETRGHANGKVTLNCETVSLLDWKPGKLLPTQILKVKVLKADLAYEQLKIDHTAGVGGDAAKIIGDASIKAIKLLKPNLEEELIEKANAAIIKAADNKELKLEMEKLLNSNKKK